MSPAAENWAAYAAEGGDHPGGRVWPETIGGEAACFELVEHGVLAALPSPLGQDPSIMTEFRILDGRSDR